MGNPALLCYLLRVAKILNRNADLRSSSRAARSESTQSKATSARRNVRRLRPDPRGVVSAGTQEEDQARELWNRSKLGKKQSPVRSS